MELRGLIISEMKRSREEWRNSGVDRSSYCTWWFKFEINLTTTEIRKELMKMEKEGLVTANRAESNNTKWTLV
tara:strand:+ start:2052 stop:2270 length:219 start_codon:yes stop_codon:yes gene_type:complete